MTEAEWLAGRAVDPLRNWLRTRRTRAPRKERLFACACCRRFADHLTDARSGAAVVAAERFADGHIGKKELGAARLDATRAARAAGGERFGYQWRIEDAVQLLANLNRDDTFIVSPNRLLIWAAREGWTTDGEENAAQVELLRDVFGNPFRPVSFFSEWRTDTAVSLARTMYDARDFSAMPILADALQDAGCDHPDILAHCRDASQVHVRGCWVCDLVLGKA